MSVRVVRPDPAQLAEAGYPKVAHIPFLLHSDGSYLALENRYIRARALHEWPLRMGTNNEATRPKNGFQTLASCISLARRMREFSVWVERVAARMGLGITTLSYENLCSWQDGLISGAHSSSGRPIEPATINLYMTEACYFLTWLSLVPKRDDGTAVRPPFEVATKSVAIESEAGTRAHRSFFEVQARVGSLDVVPSRELALPAPQEVKVWLSAMRHRSNVKSLMAETILTSGMRISEVNSMDIDTLPPRKRWKVVAGRIHFFISKGVKGRKTSPASQIAKRGRTVSIPFELAERIDAYRTEARELQVRRWIREPRSKSEQLRRAANRPQQLWLSESSNQPFANQQLRRIWSSVPACPPGWNPHTGRKYFAVEWLVESTRLQLAARGNPSVNVGWIDSIMRNQIDTFLRPTLGHLSIETTNLYIRGAIWRLADILGLPSLKYQDAQDCDLEGDSGI